MAAEKRLIAESDIYKLFDKTGFARLHVGDIDVIPRVDAVEVVHAHWEPHKMVPGFVQCSACRDCITYDEWPDGQKWKYCPNCGAKMDGKIKK